MENRYHARWVSKERHHALKRAGGLGNAIMLDSLNGFLIVEPVGSRLGDGPVLKREEADYELRDVWCHDSRKKIDEARRLLGLEVEEAVAHFVGAL